MAWERARFSVLVLPLALVLVACGKVAPLDDPGAASAGPAPPSGSGEPAPVVDAAVPAPRLTGYVSMTSADGGFYAGADFPVERGPKTMPPTEPCTTYVRRVAVVETPSESAGDIVIDVPARSGSKSSTLSFDPAHRRYDAAAIDAIRRDTRIELADAPIRVHARGAGIPAFEATIRSAYDAQLLEPTEAATLSSSSGDLLLRWSDGGNQGVAVTLAIGDSEIQCSFPASAGTGIIPAAQLQEAIAGSNVGGCQGQACTTLVFAALRSSHVASGDYDVSVTHTIASTRYLHVAVE